MFVRCNLVLFECFSLHEYFFIVCFLYCIIAEYVVMVIILVRCFSLALLNSIELLSCVCSHVCADGR